MFTMKCQEAFSLASPCSYDVFLSYRGEDTRKTFTDYLYTALDQARFHAFRDDDSFEKGENIKFELEKAIRESRISIIVFSKNYASSTWCLDELVMINKRRTSGHVVLPIFYGVDPSDVRKQNGSYQEALMRHEENLKSETDEMEKQKLKDKLGTWRAALREATDVAGMNLQDQVLDGYEARCIQKIIKVVGDKLSRTSLDIAPHLVGMHSRVKNIQLWLEDGPSDVGIVAICGMGGIGKTTTAAFLYNFNMSRFEGSSFIANVREISQQKDGLLRLQRQFIADICKTRKVKLNNIAEGAAMIKDALSCRKVLVVLDDVDKLDQLDALVGIRGWLFPGSKIIITTRRERLLDTFESCKVHRIENLSDEESLELLSWHAFRKSFPNDGYGEVSKRVVSYCEGIPLAIKVIGSSLSGKCLKVWKSQLVKLKAIPDSQINKKLRISYDSLQDDHDKRLFVNLACFFIGSDNDSTITILDECDFYTVVGIQNLIDRCLISIDESSNKLVMHHLLQEMGREIVRQESPKEPGKRSIIWNHEDAFNVLSENTGTSEIKGLRLDICLLKEEAYASTIFYDSRRHHYNGFLSKPLLLNLGGSLKRYGFSISSHNEATDPINSNPICLEANTFARMNKLQLLQLNRVYINGPYMKFPKGLRWLCWHGFPLKSIPDDFPLERLVALDMQYSCLKNVWKRSKLLRSLKILNLSHSYSLTKTPNLSLLPNLERLVLKSCTSLGEVHECIGSLERLVLLDLEDCKTLRNLPRSICMLKHLETLIISGCSNLDRFPTNMGKMESLTVVLADGIALNQSVPTNVGVNAISFAWPWRLKLRESPDISWPSLPRSLVKLSLAKCNLSEDDFPRHLWNLCSLKELDLSSNQLRGLPDFVRGLTKLESLYIHSCPRLIKLDVVPQLHGRLYCGGNRLLEQVTLQTSHRPTTTCLLDTCNHPDTLILFKLESIENVEAEIVNKLGLSNLQSIAFGQIGVSIQSMGNLTIKPMSSSGEQRWFPYQVCYETYIISAFILGGKVPPWFSFKNLGCSIDLFVPLHPNSRIQGFNVCSIYENSSDPKPHEPHTVISNRTKHLVWSYCPEVFGTAKDGEDRMWLSYWNFGNHLEGGDEVNISVYGGEFVQVKEVGVRLLYTEEQEEMRSQSAYEDSISHKLHQFGNVVPGNVSAQQQSTELYLLGYHANGHDWKYCQHLYPLPWIPTSTPGFDWRMECWASRLMIPKSFYVSQHLGR